MKKEFLNFLLESNVLKFGDFTTKSGRKTPYFINTGEFQTGAQIAKLAGFYAALIAEKFTGKIDNLYGPAYKGIPLAVATTMTLAKDHNLDLSYTFNRKEIKDHGEGGMLVGDKYTQPKKVLIIEDVITAGTSINETMEALKNLKHIEIVGLVISVNRKEKVASGKSAIQEVKEKYGLETHAIVDIEDIINLVEDQTTRKKFNIPHACVPAIKDYRLKYGV